MELVEFRHAIDFDVANVAPMVNVSGSPATIVEGGTYTLTLGPVTDPGQDTVAEYIVAESE